jgi:hypothetical protein
MVCSFAISTFASSIRFQSELVMTAVLLFLRRWSDAVQSGRKKTREPKEENVTLGPAVREGEHVFGVAHIFASFNDTFIVRRSNPRFDSHPILG